MVKAQGGNIYIIIVAAGSGTRFGTALPKQFELLGSRPVVMHAIERLSRIGGCAGMLLVLNPAHRTLWNDLCQQYGFESPHVVNGGDSRTASVRNALAALPHEADNDDAIVLIHDGARPLVDVAKVEHNIIGTMKEYGAKCVIPYLPVTDTLMTNEPKDALPVDRSHYVAVQTPQAFNGRILMQSYASMPTGMTMTDDASVVRKYGSTKIHLAEGSAKTIKITYPTDLVLAEVLLSEERDC